MEEFSGDVKKFERRFKRPRSQQAQGLVSQALWSSSALSPQEQEQHLTCYWMHFSGQ